MPRLESSDGAEIEAHPKSLVHRHIDGANGSRVRHTDDHEAKAERRLLDEPRRDEQRVLTGQPLRETPGSAGGIGSITIAKAVVRVPPRRGHRARWVRHTRGR